MECEDTLTDSLIGSWTVIGLMSGTSLDGLDVAVAQFSNDSKDSWKGELLRIECFRFPKKLEARLRYSMKMNAEELSLLDIDWALFASECVNSLNVKADLLASHGHTVFHNPQSGYTVQIGSGAHLASRTNLAVVCDMRRLDVAYGGQGAPLVPMADKYLFSEYSACLNLGGFANITNLTSDETRAWDIGPCNNLLNWLVTEISMPYDEGGVLSASGLVLENLLKSLRDLPYHQFAPPKSLGMEWINESLKPVFNQYHNSPLKDRLRTAVEYISEMIIKDCPHEGKILVTGGGVWNVFLIETLNNLLKVSKNKCEFVIPSKELVDGKEAFAFAFLGLLRLQKKPNIFTSVTGSRKASSGGAVWLP